MGAGNQKKARPINDKGVPNMVRGCGKTISGGAKCGAWFHVGCAADRDAVADHKCEPESEDEDCGCGDGRPNDGRGTTDDGRPGPSSHHRRGSTGYKKRRTTTTLTMPIKVGTAAGKERGQVTNDGASERATSWLSIIPAALLYCPPRSRA